MRKQLARMSLSEFEGLPRVGFWWSSSDPEFPHPRDFVDERWDESERQRVIEYLESSYLVPLITFGPSWCRMGCPGTPADIGSQDLTDGTWVYPEGLIHYLKWHGVKPPEEFLEHLRRNGFNVPILPTIEPGSGNAPVLLLDVPKAETYEYELVIRFPAKCLGPGLDIRGSEYDRLLEEFSDKLPQAVNGLGSDESEACTRTGSGITPRGRCTRYLYPALPYGAPEGSEITEFDMDVNCPVTAFMSIKPLLISHNLINDAVVAWRHNSEKPYQVIWPIGYRERFDHCDELL
jgi:hypothetical protein